MDLLPLIIDRQILVELNVVFTGIRQSFAKSCLYLSSALCIEFVKQCGIDKGLMGNGRMAEKPKYVML